MAAPARLFCPCRRGSRHEEFRARRLQCCHRLSVLSEEGAWGEPAAVAVTTGWVGVIWDGVQRALRRCVLEWGGFTAALLEEGLASDACLPALLVHADPSCGAGRSHAGPLRPSLRARLPHPGKQTRNVCLDDGRPRRRFAATQPCPRRSFGRRERRSRPRRASPSYRRPSLEL